MEEGGGREGAGRGERGRGGLGGGAGAPGATLRTAGGSCGQLRRCGAFKAHVVRSARRYIATEFAGIFKGLGGKVRRDGRFVLSGPLCVQAGARGQLATAPQRTRRAGATGAMSRWWWCACGVVWARAQVSILYRADLPLRGFDNEARKTVAENLAKRGIEVRAP